MLYYFFFFGFTRGNSLITPGLLNVGFGNFVLSAKVVAVISPDSAPVRRLVREAGKTHRVVDATAGRRIESVIITDTNHIILSAIQTKSLSQRLMLKRKVK